MYQEEYYQDKIDYQSQDNDSITFTDSSLDSDEKKYLKQEYSTKVDDRGYYSYKKKVGYETIKIECYATDLFKNIRHAITGVITKHRAGSKHQDLYFTVADTTGQGRKLKFPKHLFYDSPEEYERHQHIQLSNDTKERWYVKNLKARRALNK
jgi:hypothetical protein